MKYSIITPTHSKENLPKLIELYATIISQTYINWEWVLLLNGDISAEDLPDFILRNSNVNIFEEELPNANIGLIKDVAFNKATGQILVEADHDDMLAINCLEELHKVFSKQKDVGFVYSDALLCPEGKEALPYNPDHGWSYKTYNFRGQELPAMNSFEPSSHSLAYIWYAPDHVRAWRASTYEEIEGHNINLNVCDDHEICIRTYLHTKMVHIPKPLYVYRLTGDNTYLKRNKEIQKQTIQLFEIWAERLALRDSELKGLQNISVGKSINNYKNINFSEYGLDLQDNSVGVLRLFNLNYYEDPIFVMSEAHRVLAHGGWLFATVPSTDGRGAFQDPTSKSYWNENSFLYYTNSKFAKTISNDSIRFQDYRTKTYFENETMRVKNICMVDTALVAVKDNDIRYPGLLEI